MKFLVEAQSSEAITGLMSSDFYFHLQLYFKVELMHHLIPLKEKHGESIVPSWNTNQLSPGTKFMAKMSKKIQKAIREGRFCKHKKVRIIFNDSTIPGEGEAKIYPYIRQIK